MKRLLMILCITMTVTFLSSCETENNVIPLVLYNELDPYILEFKENIIAEAEGVVEIKSYDAQNSQLLQNEIIEDLLENNPKVLIINPVDRLGAYALIEKAKEKDIPIVFINREPLKTDMNSWDKLYYIGAPAEHSARLQSEMVADLFGNPGNLNELDRNNDNKIQLVIFKGEQGHQDAEIRTDVVIDELENMGYELEILSIEICDWNKTIAYNRMNQLIQNLDTNFELVISNNDAMALGAIDAMIENDLFVDIDENNIIDPTIDTWIPVIGIDGIADALPYIDDGYLYGTVINDSHSMSKALVELVNLLITDGNLDDLSFELIDGKYIWIDYQRYEKED